MAQAGSMFWCVFASFFTNVCAHVNILPPTSGRTAFDQNQYEAAAPLLEAECQAFDYYSCAYLGYANQFGLGKARDIEQAKQLYEKSCSNGVSEACFHLGLLLQWQGADQAPTDAINSGAAFVEYYDKACTGESAIACFMLGEAYSRGMGIRTDKTKAVYYYQAACDNFSMPGCDRLGFAYSTGEGVAVDKRRAYFLFIRACDGQVARACYSLGMAYLNGEGIGANPAAARRAFEHALEIEPMYDPAVEELTRMGLRNSYGKD